MKVICTSPSFAKYDDAPILALKKADLELVMLPADASIEMLTQHLPDAIAMIVAFTDINESLLAKAPRLKIVCKHGVGVDNIDLNATRQRKIFVTNVPDANKHAVADFAFGLILNTARQIYQAISETKAGNWPCIFATDVYGKTLGIVGLGHIGKEVARRARGFNMRVLATDAWPDREFAQQHQIEYVSLDTLTAQSDFISLHTPLTPETENMFNAARLQQMKSGAFLINVSRGGIVDEQALYEALKSGHLAGAAADVFLEEPCATHPLFTLANFAPTSHIAGYTDGAISNISARCVNNIITCVCRGKRPENIMNSL